MFKLFRYIFKNLNLKIKIEFVYLIILTLFTSLSETITISLMIPLINILIDGSSNSKIYTDALNFFFKSINSDDLKVIASLFIISIIITTFLRLKLMWSSIKISNKMATEISANIFEVTLYQPFKNHVNIGSNKIISAMSQKVSIVANVMMACTVAITSFTILISILIVLLFNSPLITLISISCFILSYIFLYLISKKKLKQNSIIIAEKFSENIKSIQEGLGSLRDILLGSYQKLYIRNYKNSFFKLQHVSGQNNFISQSPRFLLESFGMILIILIALSVSLYGSDQTILASIGLLTIGAQRMLPLCQQIYISIANIVGNKQNIIDVYDLLYNNNKNNDKPTSCEPNENINFINNLKFEKVSFSYLKDKKIFDNLNLVVLKGSKIGVIGATGAGKSTFLDILMGFLEPSAGMISVDGTQLNYNNINSWKKKIALIPQNIFLTSSSISENITFGEEKNSTDISYLEKCIAYSELEKFIKEKNEGLKFNIGERGSKLSGGQKQRIGIARALYKKKEIIIMDEATNALDEETEKKVLSNIFTNYKNLTIFMSTHNSNNLKLCDKVIELKANKVLIK